MILLAIVVEGRTEEEFVKKVLKGHLVEHHVDATPIIVGQGKTRQKKGGNVTVENLTDKMAKLTHDFGAITTLVDFYGFRNRPTDSIEELEKLITARMKEKVLPARWRDDRMFAYVQRHEFEGLLFSDVKAFAKANVTEKVISSLADIRSGYGSPEDINDSLLTAPSKRITKLIPGYSKVEHGPLVAESIGLDSIREQCPRFACWLRRLESLGGCVSWFDSAAVETIG